MTKISKASIIQTSEQGLVVFSTLIMAIIGGFLVFSLVYNIFFQLRDHTDQDRLAQSAAVVAMKAYVRAGSEPTPISQRQQITYAIDAAAQVLNIDNDFSDHFSKISVPSISRAEFEASSEPVPSSPISVVLSDSSTDSYEDTMHASAEITLGTVTISEGHYLLEGFKGVPALDVIIGARVFVQGTTRSNRALLFPGYFKNIWLNRSGSKVLVIYDSKKSRANIAGGITIIHEKAGS